jgi:hypothetical protein
VRIEEVDEKWMNSAYLHALEDPDHLENFGEQVHRLVLPKVVVLRRYNLVRERKGVDHATFVSAILGML